MAANSEAQKNIHTCMDLARAGERDRWLAALLAPVNARAHLAVLYAYAAELSRTYEAVSEPMIGQIRLQWWRETVERAAQGNPRAQPVAEGLAMLLKAGRIKPGDLIALADAREADLEEGGFARMDDFLAYLDNTSGALNRIALLVLGVDDAGAMEAARRIGRAYGLIGHLRAAAVNASQGRVMLPAEFLGGHGVSVPAMLSGAPGDGLRDAAREIGFMAAGELATARALRADIPRRALPVLALARFCDGYLARLAKSDWDVFTGKTEPAPVTAPLHVVRTMVSTRY